MEKGKIFYQQALSIQPDESYPKERIQEIESLILKQLTIDESYDKMVVAADKAFSGKEYEKAKELYRKASEIKPNEKHPLEYIDKINKLIAGFEAHKEAFTKAVIKADDLYEKKQYKEAEEIYIQASDLNPLDKHTKDMIAKCKDFIIAAEYSGAIGDIKNDVIKKGETKKYSFNPITDKKGNNTIVIEAKNLAKKKFAIIVTYGKDQNPNGGGVLPASEKEGLETYIFRLTDKEKWYKINNNWISIFPIRWRYPITFL